jgi:D-alanine-D-alanine ligase
MPPAVLVLYNEPVLPPDHPEAASEHDVLDTVSDTVKVLRAAGFAVRQLGINYDPMPLLEELKANRPAAVFNLFEGIATQTGTEISVAAMLEWLNVPFTGCPTISLALGRDKIRTKHLLKAAGLPTPGYQVIDRLPAVSWEGGWPAIVKPALQDASIGIDQESVVTNWDQLTKRVDYVFEKYGGPVLVESFVRGREFHVNVIEEGLDKPDREMLMLPLAEIAFQEVSPAWWPVYTFTAKWNVDSEEYKASPLVTPVELPPERTHQLRELARRAFRLLHCRDFARLDVRMTEDGEFHILEVNPNPYLNSLALVKGLEAIGRTHERFLVEMTLNAMSRGGTIVPEGVITVPVNVIAV